MKLIRWNNAKQRQEVCKKNFATFKKSGKYYVITVKNMPYESVYHDSNGKSAKLSSLSGSKFYINQIVSFTGLCSKTKKAALYVDNLSLKAGTTQKITFDKKDYRYTWGWHNGTNSEYKVSVSAVK